MKTEGQNYLRIGYNFNQGLHFKWNFQGIFQSPNYFHHVFVLSSIKTDKTEQFLSRYFKKMKSGDLMSLIFYEGQRQKVNKTRWIEKSKISNIDFSKLLKTMISDQLTTKIKENLIQCAIQQTQNQDIHFVVNYLLDDQTHEQAKLIKIVEDGRNQGGFPYLCNFWGNFNQSYISFTSGINFFSLREYLLQKIFNIYSGYLNSAAIKRATISLQYVDGQLMSYNSKFWKNVSFNKLEKTFYGPSASYTDDQIHFYMNDITAGQTMDFIISLELVLFTGQRLRSIKKIQLKLPSQKYLSPSLDMTISNTQLQAINLMSRQLYSTKSIIRLIKNSSNFIKQNQ